MKKLKTKLAIILCLLLCIFLAIMLYLLSMGNNDLKAAKNDKVDDIKENIVVDKEPFKHNEFYINQKINPEYIGQLYFESSLINEAVLQTDNNDKYLSTDWKSGEYSILGSIYMDFRNTMDDQNIIIYGHYVYDDEKAMFSPLHILKNQNAYNDNKYIYLHLEKEIRKYQLSYIYYCELIKDDESGEYLYAKDDMQFHLTEYDDDYFDIYFNSVKAKAFYSTDLEIKKDDKFITLQTCVRNHDELRLIVIAKEIERSEIK